MYVLKVIGARRSVLAYHRCDTQVELRELLAVYAAFGYAPTALVVEETNQDKAA